MNLTFTPDQRWLNDRIDVVLIGAGGTGSDMLVRLAKLDHQLVALGGSGIHVTVYDGDTVSPTNIGRQHFSPSAVGLNKAIVLVQSINLAYGLDWEAVPRQFDPKVLNDDAKVGTVHRGRNPLYNTSLLITCVDKAIFRAELGMACRGNRWPTLWLDTGNGRASGQVVLGHLGRPFHGLRLPNVFDLYPNLMDMDAADVDEPSCSAAEAMLKQSWPVNQMAAMLAVEMLWTLVRTGKLDYHGASFELAPVKVTTLWNNPDTWAFFGYTHPPVPDHSDIEEEDDGEGHEDD